MTPEQQKALFEQRFGWRNPDSKPRCTVCQMFGIAIILAMLAFVVGHCAQQTQTTHSPQHKGAQNHEPDRNL